MPRRESVGFLKETFPIIELLIAELHEQSGDFVTRDELADALRNSRPWRKVLQQHKRGQISEAISRAGNTVDWFSAEFTKKSVLIGDAIRRFRQERRNGKYAYAPHGTTLFATEELPRTKLYEGNAARIWVNKFERNSKARRACLDHYGPKCIVCDFDFGRQFGSVGKGFIHVHHLRPLAEVGKSYEVDPITDLCPICPNCHAMAHVRGGYVHHRRIARTPS